MDTKGEPDQRIAACSAQIANPLQFGWTCNSSVQGQLQTKPCDEKGLSGIRGLLFNARGLAYKAKGDLKSAIADFQQAVASARFAGETRSAFDRNLQQALAESAQYDQQYAQFVQQWQSCFSGASSVDEADRNIRMCDQALSYQRIVPVDRDKLIQQRATLERIKQVQLQPPQQQRPPALVVFGPGGVVPVVETPDTVGHWDFSWIGVVVRYAQVTLIFSWAAAVVVAVLPFWVFISFASTPIPVLKQRGLIAAWVGIPALMAGAVYLLAPKVMWPLQIRTIIFFVIWTDVFAALTIGQIVRQRYLKRPMAPVLSLPFVTLAVTVVMFAAAWLYMEYGAFRPPECTGDAPFSDICWHLNREGLYLASFALILVAACGVVVPANSTLVLAYERLAAWVRSSASANMAPRQERPKQREALTEAPFASDPASTPAAMPAWLTGTVASNIAAPDPWSDLVGLVEDSKEPQSRPAPMPAPEPARSEAQARPESPPEVQPTPAPASGFPSFAAVPAAPPAVPVPPVTQNLPAVMPQIPPAMTEIPQVGPPPPMQLKLKRAQRKSVLGKVIFALDARIEISAEERGLVEKYRLGDNVIYDSTARKRHTEAIDAHLDRTREHASFSDTPGAQMLGVGKTFYRLARAGISATMAGLSLRITVYSLMRGVHVECKSMEELLGAEHAIVDAAENLRTYLDVAATFDGREQIREF
jgi:hypothetical protein